ncbi:MAG: T9SS type A sorting domain-containing protein [Bacteroidales bacterium]|jgi:hypothetical protein|nr:T9SS type A sorting domain-containing protein [Bacteroidales bacterium]
MITASYQSCTSGGNSHTSVPPLCQTGFEVFKDCNGLITAILSPPGREIESWRYEEELEVIGDLTGDTARFRAKRAGIYYFSVKFDGGDSCTGSRGGVTTIPSFPSCKATFSCYQDSLYITHLKNTSSQLYWIDVEHILYLDGVPTTMLDTLLPSGSRHTLQVANIYEGDTCLSEVVEFTVPTPINAEFDVPAATCINSTREIFSQYDCHELILSDRPVYYFTWDFGNNTIFKTCFAMYQFDELDNRDITLTISDKWGCVATNTRTVLVKRDEFSASVEINPTAPVTTCQGDQITFECTYTGELYPNCGIRWEVLSNYTNHDHWINGCGGVVVPSQSGAYRVVATSIIGCQAVRITPDITFIPTPSPLITGTLEICLGQEVSLSGYSGADYTYAWSQTAPTAAANIGNTSRLRVTPTQAGTYQYRLRVTPTAHPYCHGYATATVTVNPLPAIPAVRAYPSSCTPYEVKLEASPIDPNGTYHWNNGGNGAHVQVNRGGAYAVRYTDQNGCTSQSRSLSVPHSLDHYFWTFPTGCYYFCKEQLPVYVHGPAYFPDGENWYWEWFRNGQGLYHGNSPRYSRLGLDPPLEIWDEGVYQMFLKNEFCFGTTNEMRVTMAECELCDKNDFADPNDHAEVAMAECESCGMNIFHEGEYHYDPNTGTVYVHIEIMNSHGNEWSYTFYSLQTGVPLTPASGTIYPGHNVLDVELWPGSLSGDFGETMGIMLWDPYDETKRCYYMFKFSAQRSIAAGTQEDADEESPTALSDEYVKLYPNPAQRSCTVSFHFNEEGDRTLVLCDILGRQLARQPLPTASGTVSFDLSPHANGLYFIECREAEGVKKVMKVVKN